MTELEPLWKTPSREQAAEILRACRASTDHLLAPLTPEQLTVPTPLGDGTWSIKDLLGHLATWEARALVVAGARPKSDEPTFTDVDELNAHHLARGRAMSLDDVRAEYDDVRTALIDAIEAMSDEQWLEKIPAGKGRSARALVIAKLLNGNKYGYLAHDLAHRADLEKAVASVT
jgi:uncharacterized protein (TIGR03083 family)